MNRNEAKAYALNELGLDRDTVRQFGNLSWTQTWLDAIAAQASGGIAAQDAIAPCKTMIVEETPAIAIAASEVIVEDAIAAQASGGIAPTPSEVIIEDAVLVEDAIAPSAAVIVEKMPGIALAPNKVIVEEAVLVEDAIAAIPEPISQDPSFETFWDRPPALLQPQPLLNISVLDGDWDEPEPPASQASEVIVYPLVIGLLMLWAIVQLLLFAGRGIAVGLTALANALDAAASHRLQTAPSRLHPQLGLRRTTLVLG